MNWQLSSNVGQSPWITRGVFMLSLFLPSTHQYNLTCPVAVHWNLRAKGYCPAVPTDKYYCLYDVLHKNYTEGCKGPDWDRKGPHQSYYVCVLKTGSGGGAKRVISGDFTRGECSEDRYQPFDFHTNGSSDCVYFKSLCSGEGEIISSNGSGYLDRTCRCDFTKGYSYVHIPKDLCFCHPSTEDCSCVRANNSAIDMTCPPAIGNGDKDVIIVKDERLETYMTWDKGIRRKGTLFIIFVVSICLVMLIIVSFLMLQNGDGILLPTNPRLKSVQLQICNLFYKAVIIDDSVNTDEIERQTSVESGNSNSSSGENEEEVPDDFDNDKCSSMDIGIYAPEPKKEEPITTDEINYLRTLHLIFVVASPIVRMFFSDEISLKDQQLISYRNGLNNISKKTKKWNFNWSTPTKEHTQLTESLDIKTMILWLKEWKVISISDRLPIRTDQRTDALLGRILYYRNLLVDAVDGRLSHSDFERYWNDLGQTLLRLAARYLTVINQKKNIKEQLLALSPLKANDPRLHRYIMVTEIFPQLILQQLLREYCEETYNDQTMISFIQDEKHTLFHKRKNQYYCCSDRCGEKSFSSIIPKEIWNKFYMYHNNELTHKCKYSNKQKCFLRYEVNFNFDLKQAYTSDLILLVLNTPRLLRYAVRRMYENSFRIFLDESRHVLFHAVESLVDMECCICSQSKTSINVKAMLTLEDWKKLYQQTETTCNNKHCCCRYSPKDIDIVHLDYTLLFKLFSLIGPFQTFEKCKLKILDSFLCWDDKEKDFIDARDVLVKTLKDPTFKDNLLSRFSTNKILDEGYVSTWILRNVSAEKATSSSKTDLVVIFKEGGKLASKNVTVSQNVQVCSSDLGVTESPMTDEENNFLKVNYMLMQVVQPVVRKVFDKFIPKGRKLTQVISDIFYRDLENQNSKKDENTKAKESLQLSFAQRDRLFHKESFDDETTSKDLDLSLMIRILEENKEKINENESKSVEIFENLTRIKAIKKHIIHSPNGVLQNADFDKYWGTLSKFVISQGGEEYQQFLNRLKERPMLKVG